MLEFTRVHLLACAALTLSFAGGATAQVKDLISQPGYHWVGTWGASPSASPSGSTPVFSNATLRMIAHVSLTTNSLVRVRLSNAQSTGITFSDVHFAQWAGSATNQVSNIVPGTDQTMTFNGGASSVNVPAGADVVTDWIYFPSLKSGMDVAVSLYLPTTTTQSTLHVVGESNSYFLVGSDASGSVALTNGYAYGSRPFLSGVEVAALPTSSAIVTLGDSITDGVYSTADGDVRWPDDLGVRLQAQYGNQFGIANAGIGGNLLLADSNPNVGIYASLGAIHRLERDVLSVPGIKYLILFEGVNDIGTSSATAAQLIEGYRIVIARAHELGIYVYGGTLTPFGGSTVYSAANEQVRQAVNTFIRTSGAYDGVIDFDKALADPANPTNILAIYNSDGLHPNNAGYQAMANAVNLSLFSSSTHP